MRSKSQAMKYLGLALSSVDQGSVGGKFVNHQWTIDKFSLDHRGGWDPLQDTRLAEPF